MEKVTKEFLSADIPLYKQNNNHIKNLFHDLDHSLSYETTSRKTVLQLSADKLDSPDGVLVRASALQSVDQGVHFPSHAI